MVKIGVLVSGNGTNLQAMIDSDLSPGEISVVISSSQDAYALTRAEKAGIEGLVIQPGEYTDREGFTLGVRKALEERGIELVVFAGFNFILKPCFFEKYRNRALNVHPSLIPSFCGEGYYGLKVHKAALDYGVKITGATVHYVDEEVDHGPIIMQKAAEVLPGDTPESLQERVMEHCEWVILPKAVKLACCALEKRMV